MFYSLIHSHMNMSENGSKHGRLNSPTPIKLHGNMRREIKLITRKTGLSFPDVMRLSIKEGLPLVRARLLGQPPEAKAA